MSLLLRDRDYVADRDGGVCSASGSEAVLAEVLFRLTARRGSFPLLPELGSRLYMLRTKKPSEYTQLARQYAAEALTELDDVTVVDAVVTNRGNHLNIDVMLTWHGQPLSVELEG